MTKHAASYMSGKAMAGGTLGFLVAAAIGATLGVLFAPKAGTDTRRDMAEKARQLAWRFRRSRAQMQESIQEIFGQVNDELEETYLQIRGEILAKMDSLDAAKDTREAYFDIVQKAVRTFSKGKNWSKAQIDRLVSHLEDEYEEPKAK